MKSIGKKLISLMLTVTIVGMALIAAASLIISTREVLSETTSSIQYNTLSEANRINGWLDSQETFIDGLAVDLAFVDTSEETLIPLLEARLNENDAAFDVYVGWPDGSAAFATGWVPDYEGGWAANERPWYTDAMANPDEPIITAPYTDAQTGNLCITSARTIFNDGQPTGVAAADIFITTLTDIVNQTNVADDSYAFLTDSAGNILIHPDEAFAPGEGDAFQSLPTVMDGLYADMWEQTKDGGATVRAASSDGGTKYFTAQKIDATGWILYTAVPVNVVYAPIYQMAMIIIPIFAAVLIIAIILLRRSVKGIVTRPMTEIAGVAEKLSDGELDINLPDYTTTEAHQLSGAFAKMAATTASQTKSAEAVANGDLTTDIQPLGENDKMGLALKKVIENLNEMLLDISGRTSHLSSVSTQISDGAQVLAEGATEQASTVVQLSNTIDQISVQSQQNTELAQQAASFANQIRANAEDGSSKMELMVQSMKDVNEASHSIEKVIKDIDDIAFQTNILALNAAVEAARAGTHGKGFAVVAEEVRNLAAKSAESAKSTALLIESSIQKAEVGAKIADDTLEALMEIVSGINDAVGFLNEISSSSERQSEALSQVNDGIEQVSTVTQRNSATAQESAAASHELTVQANMLQSLVSRFKLKKDK